MQTGAFGQVRFALGALLILAIGCRCPQRAQRLAANSGLTEESPKTTTPKVYPLPQNLIVPELQKLSLEQKRAIVEAMKTPLQWYDSIVSTPDTIATIPDELFSDLVTYLPNQPGIAGRKIFSSIEVYRAIEQLPEPKRSQHKSRITEIERSAKRYRESPFRSLPVARPKGWSPTNSVVFGEPISVYDSNGALKDLAQYEREEENSYLLGTEIHALVSHAFTQVSETLPEGVEEFVHGEFERLKKQFGESLAGWTMSLSGTFVKDGITYVLEHGSLVPQSRSSHPSVDKSGQANKTAVLWCHIDSESHQIRVSPRFVRACFLEAWEDGGGNAIKLRWGDLSRDPQRIGTMFQVYAATFQRVMALFQRNIGFFIAHEMAHVALGISAELPESDEFQCDQRALQACIREYGEPDIGAFKHLLFEASKLGVAGSFWGVEQPLDSTSIAEIQARFRKMYKLLHGENYD